MPVFTGFKIVCAACGHRNLPHPSPRKAIEIALRGEVKPCRKCGRPLRLRRLNDRPLVRELRAKLLAEGVQPSC